VYQRDTEIIFPMRVASGLSDLRGSEWKRLVELASHSPDASENQLAFSLLLIRLSGCLTCRTSSYRAMRGCTICAKHSVLRYRGDDSELASLYDEALVEVRQHISAHQTEAAQVPVD
jgi:hypothetical protein